MAPIGVAILGGGIFAREEHLPAVLATPLLSLKAIYSRSLQSAQAVAALVTDRPDVIPDLYAEDAEPGRGLDDLLARADVAAVIVALPIMNQLAFTKRALAAGKHVLAEKPIGPDVQSGKELLSFYDEVRAQEKTKGVTLAVAENWRFLPSYAYAAAEARKLGKVTSFSVRAFSYVPKEGHKYLETPWRKTPQHQGGFVLDGGVHYTAGLRLLLGPDAAPASVIALSAQVQDYLPPVDTVHSLITTTNGAIGSFAVSMGSTLPGWEFGIACEHGSVTADSTRVTVRTGAVEASRTEHVESFARTWGVKEEVQAWAETLVAGQPNELQAPELALGDLELLEAMLRSGEGEGAVRKLQYQ